MSKEKPPIQETKPEVFILESLDFDDEQKERYEGKILFNVLRMCNKKPIYYYFRTKEEFEKLVEKFRESGYRFLHISCHGNSSSMKTTLDTISYVEMASVLEGNLKNRRLFLSACELGNVLLHTMISGKNKGMYSIVGPQTAIRFDISIAVWSTLYVKLFSVDHGYVKNSCILQTLTALCNLFDTPFQWSWYNAKIDKFEFQTIDCSGKNQKQINALKKIEENDV